MSKEKLFTLDLYNASLGWLKQYLDNHIAEGTSSHDHSNKTILDKITEPFTTADKKQITDNATEINKIKDGATSVGNAATADKLKNARNFSISGGATASAVSFDGSKNVELKVTSLNAMQLTVANTDTLVLNGDCI